MTACLSSPSVWRGMFGHAETPPWSFVVLACAGGSSHVAGITVPQLCGGAPAAVLPAVTSEPPEDDGKGAEAPSVARASSKLEVRSLHLIGQRDLGRADSEAIASWFAPEIATHHLLECAHELPAPLRRSTALTGALEAFLSSDSKKAGCTSTEATTAAVAAS